VFAGTVCPPCGRPVTGPTRTPSPVSLIGGGHGHDGNYPLSQRRGHHRPYRPHVSGTSRNSWQSRKIYVAIDAATTDNTGKIVWDEGGCAFYTAAHGKGENVLAGLKTVAQNGYISPRIILCDGDYTGFTTEHIDRILRWPNGMTVGIPDWPDCEVPYHVTMSWPLVSGFRCLPHTLIPNDAHGYLLETQINLRAIKRRMPIHQVTLEGLKAPFTWPLSERRLAAMEADRAWGKEHGIL
jgi:hypothetical protein